MQIVRFRAGGLTRYGVLDGSSVIEYSGTPWSLFKRGRRRHALRQVILLAPTVPSKIVASTAISARVAGPVFETAYGSVESTTASARKPGARVPSSCPRPSASALAAV